MNRMRSISIVLVAAVVAACATETVEQRVLRETAASLLEQFAYDGYPPTFPEIARQLRREAEAGNVRSQTRLGELYLYGFGVPKDEVERVKWHRKAAEGGGALSQYFLAWNYMEGNAVEQDYRQALEWFRRSAAQGFESARVHFERLRPKEANSSIAADSKVAAASEAEYSSLRSTAARWIESDFRSGVGYWRWKRGADHRRYALRNLFSAANSGFAKAQYLIGVAYLSGGEVQVDRARAAHWFLKAASQNHGPARREYCALFRAGRTAPADGPPNSDWCDGVPEP